MKLPDFLKLQALHTLLKYGAIALCVLFVGIVYLYNRVNPAEQQVPNQESTSKYSTPNEQPSFHFDEEFCWEIEKLVSEDRMDPAFNRILELIKQFPPEEKRKEKVAFILAKGLHHHVKNMFNLQLISFKEQVQYQVQVKKIFLCILHRVCSVSQAQGGEVNTCPSNIVEALEKLQIDINRKVLYKISAPNKPVS